MRHWTEESEMYNNWLSVTWKLFPNDALMHNAFYDQIVIRFTQKDEI